MANYKSLLLFAVCALVAAATARHLSRHYELTGRVYCDTCRVGFVTSASEYIHGATVAVQCKDKSSWNVLYMAKAQTNQKGNVQFTVPDYPNDQICDMMLVDSPRSDCKTADPGQSRSRVTLTNLDDKTSSHGYANVMGFLKDEPLADCASLNK